MKTRVDFVSNSSSCSFIVEEPEKLMKLVHEKLGGEKFFNDLASLDATAEVDSSDRAVLEKLSKKNVWEYNSKAEATFSLGNLADATADDISKITRLDVTCEDYETDKVAMLSVLKRALENAGVKVDSSCSEMELMFEDDDTSTMSLLYLLAFSTKDEMKDIL